MLCWWKWKPKEKCEKNGTSHLKNVKLLRLRSDVNSQLFAVAVKTIKECKSKAVKLLKIPINLHLSLTNGIQLTDDKALMRLPQNSIVVCSTESGIGSQARMISTALSMLRMNPQLRDQLMAAANQIVNKEEKILMQILASGSESRSHAETREEDPEWFERVADRKLSTKSAVLGASAMNRVRSYYYEAKGLAKNVDGEQQVKLDNILKIWHNRLKGMNMYKHYFMRKNPSPDPSPEVFCDLDGWFTCEGVYNEASCQTSHQINPYATGEQRALFSQWNLDHSIEKNRTVLPKFLEALREKHDINERYFYDLMFTRANLKLVHTACHLKTEHKDALIDDKQLFQIMPEVDSD